MTFIRSAILVVFLFCCGIAQGQIKHTVSVGAYSHGLARIIVSEYSNRRRLPEPSREKWGLITINGKLLADTVYDYISDVSDEGVIILVRNNKIGLMDTMGNFISSFVYGTDRVLWPEPAFQNGFLPVVSNSDQSGNFSKYYADKVGFINSQGRLIIDMVYDLRSALRYASMDMMEDGPAPCGEGEHARHEYVSRHPWYIRDGFYQFSGGTCLVVKDGVNMVIDTTGNVLYVIDGHVCRAKNIDGIIEVDRHHERRSAEICWPPDTVGYDVYNKKGKIMTMEPGYDLVGVWNKYWLVNNNREKRTAGREIIIFDPKKEKKAFKTTFNYVDIKDGVLHTNIGIYDEHRLKAEDRKKRDQVN